MLQRIQKGLKWVANHTGISWVLGKISSGWNWLFGSSDANQASDASQTGGETPVPVKDNSMATAPQWKLEAYLGVNENNLTLTVDKRTYDDMRNDYYQNQPHTAEEFRAFVKCGDAEFRVIGRYDSSKDQQEGLVLLTNSIVKRGGDGKFEDKDVINPNSGTMETISGLLNVNIGSTYKITWMTPIPSQFVASSPTPEDNPAKGSVVKKSPSAPIAGIAEAKQHTPGINSTKL